MTKPESKMVFQVTLITKGRTLKHLKQCCYETEVAAQTWGDKMVATGKYISADVRQIPEQYATDLGFKVQK